MNFLAFIFICWLAVRFLSIGRERREERLRRARAPEPLPPLRPAVESPEQKLRRQYVEGSLTVEQYERELDLLYRGK